MGRPILDDLDQTLSATVWFDVPTPVISSRYCESLVVSSDSSANWFNAFYEDST